MHCLACNAILTDREASRKYENFASIKNPEDQYINLCTHCLKTTDLTFSENPNANDEEVFEEEAYEADVFPFVLQDSDSEF